MAEADGTRSGGDRESDPADPDAHGPAGRHPPSGPDQEGGSAAVTGRRGRDRFRIAAGLLVGLGLVAVAGAWYVPAERTLLVVAGGIGVFGGVLTYYLTRGRFVPAPVSRGVQGAMAANQAALLEEFDGTVSQVYLPSEEGCVLSVRGQGEPLPAVEELTVPQVALSTGEGLALVPTGEPLLDEVEATLHEPLSGDPEILASQIAEGLQETLEIARVSGSSLDVAAGRLEVELTDTVYRSGFDTPAVSFVAVALATGLGRPVEAWVLSASDDGCTVTCHWNPDEV